MIVAKHAGVCFGVKRATDMAFRAARNYRNHVYTIGPRIHTPQVVKQLREAAIIVKEGIGDIAEGRVIFRSHGLPFHWYASDGVLRFIKVREAQNPPPNLGIKTEIGAIRRKEE